MLAIVLAAAGVAVGALIVSLVTGGSDAEVRLEPVAATLPDEFTPSTALGEAPLRDGLVVPPATTDALPALATTGEAASLTGPLPATRTVAGSLPGLYGGTRDNSSCDADQLVAFLAADADKAAAWAAVFGIAPSEIDAFVADLTPAVLTRDTRVTNHGYRNGQATRVQAVLQAGTAVLVDDRGVPTVKCGCGNPLLAPVTFTRDTTVQVVGNPWPGLRYDHLVEVGVDTRIDVFILIELTGGDPFERPVGSKGDADGGLSTADACDLFPDDELLCPPDDTTTVEEPELGTGDVQATLRWTSDADLDLAVTDPAGEAVSFMNRLGSSGGELDYDVIPCTEPDHPRVENVFWPPGAAPNGTYTVTVTYFSSCNDAGPHEFELLVLVDGAVTIDEIDVLAMPGDELSWTFDVGDVDTAVPVDPEAEARAFCAAVGCPDGDFIRDAYGPGQHECHCGDVPDAALPPPPPVDEGRAFCEAVGCPDGDFIRDAYGPGEHECHCGDVPDF